MNRMWLVDCANCGRQTMIDGPESNCQFCGKNASKKEVIVQENKERSSVPPKPKKRSKLDAYWEKHKEAILADYSSLKIREFLNRWSMATTTWMKLKKKWGVPNKSKSSGSKPGKQSTSEDKALSEHERYLVLLGYQQATQEFLRAEYHQQ